MAGSFWEAGHVFWFHPVFLGSNGTPQLIVHRLCC